jgi:type IV secretion system protein VirB10
MKKGNSVDKIDEIDGDRSLPSVNERHAPSAMKKIMMFLFLVFCILFIAVVAYFSFIRKKQQVETKQQDMQMIQAVPERGFDLPPEPPPIKVVPAKRPVASDAPLPGTPESLPAPKIDKSGAALMLSAGVGRGSAGGEAAPPRRGSSGESGNRGEGALAGMLTPTTISADYAMMLPDRNYLLTKGNSIECVLQRRLVSTVAGTTACITNRNVYSSNGNVLLIERGSRLVAEYRSSLKQGEERIFVLWSRIETPHGVIINVDSPGMDALGGGGIPGHVDTHFWERFGGAVMLSVVDMSMEVAKERAKRTTGDTTNYGGSEQYSEVASEALRNSINIPPTLYVNQGDRIMVDVVRDLDFSTVYDLALSKKNE